MMSNATTRERFLSVLTFPALLTATATALAGMAWRVIVRASPANMGLSM